MASKPRSEWTPAYRRRVESAERRGLTRQQARGHRPQEHRVRAQRAREAGKLTESDKRWLKRQQNRIQYDRASEVGKARWDAAAAEFAKMTPEERFNTRVTQRERQQSTLYSSIYAPMYGDVLTPLYLSSRSGLR